MSHPFSHYQESAAYLRAQLGPFVPRAALILGSGLGDLAQEVEHPVAVPYAAIPHFPRSTAPGHVGQLVFGTLSGQNVAVMQGRVHHYEGYSYEDVAYGVRVLRLLGCDTLLVTNAAGCVHTHWRAGDIMLITDQIKLAGDSPLRGENLPQFGVRFPDASHLYTPRLQQVAREVAQGLGTPLREGVYYYSFGPQYETPAEIRAIRLLGGDAVGMSTAPEVIVAAHCGMEVLGFSLLSNMAAGMLPQPLSEEEVLEAGKAARHRFAPLVLGCLAAL
ncbi:MAG TPA: purine-nucleoside phosphorylase [Candidatus Enterenecus avicola]|nr:purine-nucleoside phosphorylase [Candidatus Enterenecus avicola]